MRSILAVSVGGILASGLLGLGSGNLQEENRKEVSVAVVGAGIGGSAASHFLREALEEGSFHPNVNVVVFERGTAPGGRTQHIEFDGNIFEAGASVIYTGNRYLSRLSELVHLKRLDASEQEGPSTGLWDGKRFVLSTTTSGMANLVRMLWRYGR